MITALKKIHEFNDKAGLLTGYNDLKEAAMVIEESLEQLDTHYLAIKLHCHEDASPKELSRTITTGMCIAPEDITDVQRFDKILDQIFIAFGGGYKLGLDTTQILKGLNVVCDKNLQKLGAPLDGHGKQTKPDGWVGPEPLLELILSERK